MRVGSILFHNIDNEQIVIMDESSGNEITMNFDTAKELYFFLSRNVARQ